MAAVRHQGTQDNDFPFTVVKISRRCLDMTVALCGLPVENFYEGLGACRSPYEQSLGAERPVIQAMLMVILQRFGDLPHQAKAGIDIQRLTSIMQEPIEALGLGIVFKNQRRPPFVLVQIESFENPCMVDALQQPELPFRRLPSHTTAEFCRLQRLRIDTHTARDPGEPDMGGCPVLIHRGFPRKQRGPMTPRGALSRTAQHRNDVGIAMGLALLAHVDPSRDL